MVDGLAIKQTAKGWVMDRKLAAILAADIVGYSAMMERDEAATHDRVRVSRKELFEPTIVRHHGDIFKLMGDGLLAEFSSVVEAVECAVSLQRGLAERNAFAADQRIHVRIGVNLGEVIVEGDDRFGEGVNIAARLEQLAEPDGIWVSAKVAREVEKSCLWLSTHGASEGQEHHGAGRGLPRDTRWQALPRRIAAYARGFLALAPAYTCAGRRKVWFGGSSREKRQLVTAAFPRLRSYRSRI